MSGEYVDTMTRFQNFKKPTPKIIKIHQGTIRTNSSKEKQKEQQKEQLTKVVFEEIDTLDCAQKYKGLKILVLNFANGMYPCKDTIKGDTQEEDLCIRTNLAVSLRREFYPLGETIVYSTDITIIKDNKTTGYRILRPKEQQSIDVVTVEAISNPKIRFEPNTKKFYYENPGDKDLTRAKIRTMLYVAEKKKYDLFITGAWGCGKFHNPRKEMCELWKEQIKCHNIPNIIFAIPDKKLLETFKSNIIE